MRPLRQTINCFLLFAYTTPVFADLDLHPHRGKLADHFFNRMPPSSAVECANLSGSWLGSCVGDSSAPSEDRLEFIQNGCDDIRIDGDRFEIPSLLVKVRSSQISPTDLADLVSLHWIQNGQRLLHATSYRMAGGPNSRVLVVHGTVEDIFMLEESRLIRKRSVDFRQHNVESDQQDKIYVGHGTFTCQYERRK